MVSCFLNLDTQSDPLNNRSTVIDIDIDIDHRSELGKIMENSKNSQSGWICIGKEHGDISRAGERYDEVIGETYRWRSSLAHGHSIKIGDVILIRDEDKLIGMSIIESIFVEDQIRQVTQCPFCKKAQVSDRPSKIPRYRCTACRQTFQNPIEFEEITEFRTAEYAAGWVPLPDNFPKYSAVKDLIAVKPKSQHSLQSLNISNFEKLLVDIPTYLLASFERRNPILHGGHVLRTVKMRIGQEAFRRNLVEKFGYICAITGPQPGAALEAAHLYQYAIEGTHYDNGGLFLRRDVHRLFDLGLIAVNPTTLIIDVHKDINIFETYKEMHGGKLCVEVSDNSRAWIALHWEQFRKNLQI